MCDKLVFDLSQEVEGSPNVFIRKDWINILDNMNQNYQNNQCIIDTSQLANSNKYMAYREGYLAMPMLGTIKATPSSVGINWVRNQDNIGDYALGLKNWFGTMIHSFTLDYNGTTIIQQTPFINMWNIFKLLTSLSYQDVLTMGPTIGFYPDTSGSWKYFNAASAQGSYVSNNDMAEFSSSTSSVILNVYDQSGFNPDTSRIIIGGNQGLTYRTKWIAYNPNAINGSLTYGQVGVTGQSCNTIWKSYISTNTPTVINTQTPVVKQYSIMAIIYLRHVHSFFNMCPLLKGVFMKMTMNLNNCSSTVTLTVPGAADNRATYIAGYTTSNAVGGVCPFVIPSAISGQYWVKSSNGEIGNSVLTGTGNITFNYNLSVGSTCLDGTIGSPLTLGTGQLSKSVYLYVPAYTFNPPFEQAYLSNSIKQIKYTDVYQYQYQTAVTAGDQFNFLVTNGIANIKSVLIIPFYKKTVTGGDDYAEYQSPFDTAGCGTTAPMVTLGNFNVQISGQNAIYNTQRYTYEEFVNQLYGQNAVNGGMTDGLNSGLINFLDFQNSYCYYYVNVERMLPVEQSVPKSVQVIGTNYSTQAIQFWIFIEYGVEVKIDVLTGARV